MQLLRYFEAPETIWVVMYSKHHEAYLSVRSYRVWDAKTFLANLADAAGPSTIVSRITEEQAHFIQQMQHELHTAVRHGLKKA